MTKNNSQTQSWITSMAAASMPRVKLGAQGFEVIFVYYLGNHKNVNLIFPIHLIS